MKVAFIPDTGGIAGLGHLSRCLAVAEAFLNIGRVKSLFITSDNEAIKWLGERGMNSTKFLEGDWDLVISDSYRTTSMDISLMLQKTKTLVLFDDNGHIPRGAHWVVNTSTRASSVNYSEKDLIGLLLGPLFHPLRSEYWGPVTHKSQPSLVKNILITLGGGESESRLYVILRELSYYYPSGNYHVVIGPYIKEIQLTSNSENIFFHRSPKNIRALLSEMDLAVSGGGQTLYELAYLGIPTLAIEVAQNQRENILGFFKAGAVIPVGDINLLDCRTKLLQEFDYLLNNQSKRELMSLAGKKMIDGVGAFRLAKVLLT